jgi:hypothetical protein
MELRKNDCACRTRKSDFFREISNVQNGANIEGLVRTNSYVGEVSTNLVTLGAPEQLIPFLLWCPGPSNKQCFQKTYCTECQITDCSTNVELIGQLFFSSNSAQFIVD